VLEPGVRDAGAGAAGDAGSPADVAAPEPVARAAPGEVRAGDLAPRPHPPRRVPVVGAAAVGRVPAERGGAARRSGLGGRWGDRHAADRGHEDGEDGDDGAPESVPAEHSSSKGRDLQ
jgi:hypothetical protein